MIAHALQEPARQYAGRRIVSQSPIGDAQLHAKCSQFLEQILSVHKLMHTIHRIRRVEARPVVV
ncbi:MAG: hypothetical protein ACTHK7_15730 [Aureliella sp.]